MSYQNYNGGGNILIYVLLWMNQYFHWRELLERMTIFLCQFLIITASRFPDQRPPHINEVCGRKGPRHFVLVFGKLHQFSSLLWATRIKLRAWYKKRNSSRTSVSEREKAFRRSCRLCVQKHKHTAFLSTTKGSIIHTWSYPIPIWEIKTYAYHADPYCLSLIKSKQAR